MKITTVKKKEKQLLQLMKEATDQSSDGIVITNAKLMEDKAKILYVNSALCKMTGYTDSELIGKQLNKLHGPKTDPQILSERRHLLKLGKSFSAKITKYRKDGSEFCNETDSAPVYDNDGLLKNVIHIMRDVSERTTVDEKKEEFLSVVGYELKTPLTSINGFIEILKKHLGDNNSDKNAEYLTIIKSEVNRLIILTNEILESTRMKKTRIQPKKKLTNIDDIIRQAIKNIKISANSHKINRRGKIGQPIYCDSERIKQVITNLLTNAIKYSPQSKDVNVQIKKENSNAVVSIQDFGIGIPSDKKDKVFDRFYRPTDKNKSVSTGLGLYISSEIVRSHGGSIWVESTEGQGSVFFFSLPVQS
jgi:PAS domain S-box-containing protein